MGTARMLRRAFDPQFLDPAICRSGAAREAPDLINHFRQSACRHFAFEVQSYSIA